MTSSLTSSAYTQPTIMQVIPELGPGGAEQGCIDVADALVKAGAQAIVVSNGGSRVHELARIGAVHIDLPVHSKNPLVMYKNVSRLHALISRYNVQVVHVRSRAPAWSVWRAIQNTNARFLTTCHAPYNFKSDMKKVYNSIMAKGELIIAISDYVADYIRDNFHVHNQRIRLIPRGVALEKFHPTAVTPGRMIALSKDWRIPDGANIIMLPGRLTRWKGHHLFIEALARLENRNIFGVIIGSDQGRTEYRKELEEIISQKGLGGQMRLVDHCNDMPAAYMLASVVVSASIEPEGFGRVPVEAQAMGRPVIATDHGGARETILRGQTGWLVPPGDIEALARSITEAMSLTATQRAVLATRAMSHVAAHFTKEQMMQKTLDVYAELIGEDVFVAENTAGSFHPSANAPHF